MEYSYYIYNYNGIDTLYRIIGKLHGNVSTLEAYHDGNWSKESKLTNPFMNKYVTGWLDDNDAMDYETAIGLLYHKIIEAKHFAVEKHGNQKYGIFPYEVHLINVLNVLISNNILPNTEENIDLWIGAWLHDVLEDTTATKQELISKFGANIYEIVWSLTDGEHGNRKEKKQTMYQKLVLNQNGIIIKLADRIANLEFSIINNNPEKINLYISENEELNRQLAGAIVKKEGLNFLNYLNNLIKKNSSKFSNPLSEIESILKTKTLLEEKIEKLIKLLKESNKPTYQFFENIKAELETSNKQEALNKLKTSFVITQHANFNFNEEKLLDEIIEIASL
jgi:(p)ppGpp synthase/HD superfamily hydrolase